MAQKDLKSRIGSVKNIQKITRAMEMVAAARLRRAEQRIEAMRPYADAIRRMTGRVVEAVERIPDMPLLEEHDETKTVGLLLVTGDRGLAGPFNSQIMRAGTRRERELHDEGKDVVFYASGKRGISSLSFRGKDVAIPRQGYTDRPAYSNARDLANDIETEYEEGNVDRVEMVFNHYESAMSQEVQRDVLLPLQQIEALVAGEEGEDVREDPEEQKRQGLWIYEPDPEQMLKRLVPDYIEISIYRALLESTASEHGARMTAMRNAQENATEMIDDLELQMNRQRQAEITQEIMEVVAGAEGLT
jgi:F-type H+-transporting ATPase subunit gamma